MDSLKVFALLSVEKTPCGNGVRHCHTKNTPRAEPDQELDFCHALALKLASLKQ